MQGQFDSLVDHILITAPRRSFLEHLFQLELLFLIELGEIACLLDKVGRPVGLVAPPHIFIRLRDDLETSLSGSLGLAELAKARLLQMLLLVKILQFVLSLLQVNLHLEFLIP